ncbi:MAG: hypothetical protein HY735_37825 [Verrucomicrobia bacterium]|nr:hypothetical protein [Verrucomicrobiota bacterium]
MTPPPCWVGTARCAVSAAFSGATGNPKLASGVEFRPLHAGGDAGSPASLPLVAVSNCAQSASIVFNRFLSGIVAGLDVMPNNPTPDTPPFRWLTCGDQFFEEVLRAIERARRSVRLETYIFTASSIGEQFRDALQRAAARGVAVRVLIDGWGSIALHDSFWEPLRRAGGEVRWFNPINLRRFAIRNHRKLVVCDEAAAFAGGFNIAAEDQPQILHGKLLIIDGVVYVGSANLDRRSFYINYELVLRLPNRGLASDAETTFAADLAQCRKVEAKNWRKSRSFWNKLKERWAYFLVARVDPLIARRQLRHLR